MTGKIDHAGLAGVIESLVQSRRAMKALAIAAESHRDWLVSLARGLAADGMLIAFHSDAEGAGAIRAEFDRAGVAARAHVMIGEPALLVKKVAGPFDVVLNCQAGDESGWRERLMPLLVPRGLLINAWQGGVGIIVKE